MSIDLYFFTIKILKNHLIILEKVRIGGLDIN
jgi:hypothetical protein